jgi:NAD-dependent DNA ligase
MLQEKQDKQQNKITLLKLLNEHIENYRNAITKIYSDKENALNTIEEVWDAREKLDVLIAGVVECTDIEKMYELGFLEDIEE